MNTPAQKQIDQIINTLDEFGKENLVEILRRISQGVQLLSSGGQCRIYLEDLTMGSLSCAAAENDDLQGISEPTFPINDSFFPIPQVYQQKQEMAVASLSRHSRTAVTPAESFANSYYLLPILHLGRAIGVVSLDRSGAEQPPSEPVLRQLRKLLSEAAPTLNRARKYHQQLLLARRVDEAKKREAALFMVKSAAQLIDRVALASVLIPVPSGIDGERTLEILASYSKEREARRLYEEEKLINLAPGESLISRFIDRAGVIVDDSLLAPLYIEDLAVETLQKRYLTENLGLKSLYIVPRYDKHNRRVICLVNYYTKDRYHFSSFERDLLDAHAEMAQRVVQEIGDEHLEIQILSEIGDLLQQSGDGLRPFLHRVLSKATQLIGADTGSLALVREFQGERWLLVEDDQGNLIGAKNKDWLKKYIPPILIGGRELPPGQRSLTGLAAATRRPQILDDCHEGSDEEKFYRPVTEAIRSEIAVPVVYEDEVLAVVCLDSLRPHYFTHEHQRILQIIARMIGHHLSILQKIDQLTSELDRLRQDVGYKDPKITSYRLGNIIGNSSKAQEIITTIQLISPPLCERITQWHKQGVPDQGEFLGLPSILITGETGAGKEFLFNNFFTELNRIFRQLMPGRSSLPLKKTNIAAYSGDLTYSELFGHKRGAFTGAHNDRRGILEEAHGGVVFLDEIGDADPKTQVQLLRFLDSGEFIRLGENITRHSQVLLVAGTNRDLRQLIADGIFREDLYHRLSELIIEVPSLNQRREDIPDLAIHLLGRLFQAYHKQDEKNAQPALSQKAKNLLSRHHYTGNIRELRSILLRGMLLRRGDVIDVEEITNALQPQAFSRADSSNHSKALNDQLAEEIFQSVLKQEQNFWSALYEPYARQEITRDLVLKVVEKARTEGATNMPRLARLLDACDPSSTDENEKKRFFRFKNFFYKTVKLRW